jgi:hypothetical protein
VYENAQVLVVDGRDGHGILFFENLENAVFEEIIVGFEVVGN